MQLFIPFFLITFLSSTFCAPIQEKQTWKDEAILISKIGAASLSEAAAITGLVELSQKRRSEPSRSVKNSLAQRLSFHAARRALGVASRAVKGESLIPNKSTNISPIQDALYSGVVVGLLTNNTAAAATALGIFVYYHCLSFY